MSKINTIKPISDLYFVAIVPPEPLLSEIEKLKLTACKRFNACAALNSPPHITLHMPFGWKRKKEDILYQFFDDYKSSIKPFIVKIEGVSHFGERVIFLSIEPNPTLMFFQSDLAKSMKRNLNLFNVNYKNKPFHPHITLAFRDLKKQHFSEAFVYFQSLNYSDTFMASQFCLLKHEGKKWETFKRFDF